VKRILVLLTVAAIFAAAMAISAVSAVAAPDCDAPQHADHPNCVRSTTAPGGSENSQGKAAEHNPNFRTTTTFQPGTPGGN
jgi:opacity protein-like surface antigen